MTNDDCWSEVAERVLQVEMLLSVAHSTREREFLIEAIARRVSELQPETAAFYRRMFLNKNIAIPIVKPVRFDNTDD